MVPSASSASDAWAARHHTNATMAMTSSATATAAPITAPRFSSANERVRATAVWRPSACSSMRSAGVTRRRGALIWAICGVRGADLAEPEKLARRRTGPR